MYCPNCGQKLSDTKHNFCPNCGNEISSIFGAPKLTIEREQYVPIPKPRSTLESYIPPITQQKVIKKTIEEPGKYSKRCLAFSITSLALTFPYFVFSYAFSLTFTFNFPPIGLQIIRNIVLLIIAALGLLFGILAKTNSSKAAKMEPKNRLEKAGSVIMIIGIVMNALNIAQAFFIPMVIIPI